MATPSATSSPRVLFLAAAIIGLEALAAVVFGVVAVAGVGRDGLVLSIGVAMLSLGYGGFLVAISRGLALGRRWCRGAAVATQLLQALLAYSFWDGTTKWIGFVLGAAALVALICVFTPAATAVFQSQPVPGED